MVAMVDTHLLLGAIGVKPELLLEIFMEEKVVNLTLLHLVIITLQDNTNLVHQLLTLPPLVPKNVKLDTIFLMLVTYISEKLLTLLLKMFQKSKLKS